MRRIEVRRARLLPVAALVALLYGCALTPGKISSLSGPDEGLVNADNRSGVLTQLRGLDQTSERITLLPQSDGTKSTIVIQGADGKEVVMDKPFVQARIDDGEVVTADTSNAATNNRYLATMAALPVRSFDDVIRRTVLSNPEVQARWQNIKISRHKRTAALLRFLPSLDFFAGIRAEDLRRPTGRLKQTGYRTSTILTQNVFEGFGAMNDVRQFDHLTKARFYDLLDISEEAAYEAARAHVDVLRYTRLTELARENLQTHQEVYDLIRERTSAGVDRRVDLELAAGRLALAQSNLATEQANLHDVSARYIRIVGQRPVNVSGGLPRNLIQKVPDSVEAGIQKVLQDSPAVRSAVELMHAAQMAEYSHNAAFQPKVDVIVQVSSSEDYAGSTEQRRESAMGVLMNWNLYRGNGDMARREQLQQLVQVARYEHESACRQVRLGFEQAFNQYNKLREQVEYLDEYQLTTDRALQAYRQQFTIGQRTLLDMLDSQNEYFEAQRDYLNADFDLQLAAAKIQQSSGRLLESLGILSLVDEAPEAALKARDDRAELRCDESFVPRQPVDKEALLQAALKNRPVR